MAEYIENVLEQTSKLDWAMPFQRTGAFPLDRSTLFSSLADAKAYAKGDGSDERSLGGASYVGQVIAVLEDDTVNAYLISKSRALTKLAATTASGDLSADIIELQGKIAGLETKVKANSDALENVYTKSEADSAIAAAVADASHLKRKIVANVAAVEAEKNDAKALEYIYMVPSGLKEDDNKYYEYVVIEIPGEDGQPATRSVEKVGSWEVDLSAYAKTTDINTELAKKANSADVYTKADANNAISTAIETAIGENTPSKLKEELDNYKTSNDAAVKKNATAIATNADEIAALKQVGAEKNTIASVSDDFSISDERVLSLNDIEIGKITNLQDTLDGYNSKVETLENIVNAKDTGLKDRIMTLENTITTLPETYLSIADFNTVVGDLAEMKKNNRKVLEDIDALRALMTWKDMTE